MVYFVLGYMLYASLLVGVGSVCTTIKDDKKKGGGKKKGSKTSS